jgi:hypothetical protein
MREITYRDELLADRTVHRRYSDGREEWRTRGPGVVTWRDNLGGSGTDEPLGRRLIKRTYGDGSVVYARDVGYGRTLWRDGVLTVNRTSFGGRIGVILGAIAGGALLGAMTLPPAELTAAEEEELRQQAQAAASSGGGDGGGAEVSWGYGDDDGGDDDFG